MFYKDKYFVEKWFILLIPISTIFSIFFLELSLVFLSLSFIYNSSKDQELKKFFKNKIFYFFIIFYFYILIRFLFVENEYQYSTVSIIFYFRYGLYFLAIFYFLKKIDKLEEHFLKILIITFIILFIDAIFQFIMGYNLLGFKTFDGNRVSSFFGDELILGSFLLRFSPFLFIFLVLNINNKFYYWFSFILIIITDIIIFITGERAAAGLIVVLTFYYLIFLNNLRILRMFSILISSLVILSLITFSTNVKDRLINKTLEEVSLAQENPNISEIFPKEKFNMDFYIVSPTHTNYIFTSINIFKDNILFGKGPKTYRYYCNDERFKINRFSCSTHPHNYYVQILAELGLFGFAFLLIAVLFILFESIKNILNRKKYSNYAICIYGFYIINFWPLTTAGNFFNNWLSILMYLPLGFYLYRFSK